MPLRPELRNATKRKSPAVLVVEPAPAMTKLLRVMLYDLGFDVIETRGAEEALTEVEGRADEIDLVVSELSLPDLSGSKLASFISQRCRSVPTVLLCDKAVSTQVQTDPAVTFLKKPFSRERLWSTIERHFTNRPRESAG